MIPPQELKNKSFTRTGKGYDAAEVDRYIDFVIEKYSELFNQCDKYDKKLRIVSSRINEIQQEEETIHKLSITTQKNCDRLLSEAEAEAKMKIAEAERTAEQILDDVRERAQTALFSIEKKAVMQVDATQKKSDALLMSARTRCTKILADFKKEITLQRENIINMKNISEEFNTKLLQMYKNHLNLLSENTYTPSVDLDIFTESQLYDNLMKEIKSDAAEIAKKNSGVEYSFEKEFERIKESENSLGEYDLKTNSDDIDDIEESEELETLENIDDIDNIDDIEDIEELEESDETYEDNEDNEDDDYGNNAYADNNDDDDVKVFAKSEAGSSQSKNKNGGFDLRFLPDSKEEDMYNEKPVATYDSDDYIYNDNDNDDDNNEEAYEETESKSESKGFFGLFKKKKKKESSLDYPDDDEVDLDYDDDREDEIMDIFEDLEDNHK